MTSESEFELVEITHFINPHLFWINRIEDSDTEYKIFYDKLQTFAEQSGTCIPHLKKVNKFFNIPQICKCKQFYLIYYYRFMHLKIPSRIFGPVE